MLHTYLLLQSMDFYIKAALGGFPGSISVLVDDDAGNEASFVV